MKRALLSGLLAVACAVPAAAKDSAVLAHVSGKVTVTVAGKDSEGKKGQALAHGDKVLTGRGGVAVIQLPEGSMLKLKESSSVTIELPKERTSGFGALLNLGGVFARVMKRAPGSEFRVRAGNAVAAVRGTEFFTAFGRKTKTGRDLWVCVREGTVDVGTAKSKKSRPVPAGKGVLIKSGDDLTDPQAYAWTEKLNWNMDPASGAVEDKTELDKAYSDLLDQDYR